MGLPPVRINSGFVPFSTTQPLAAGLRPFAAVYIMQSSSVCMTCSVLAFVLLVSLDGNADLHHGRCDVTCGFLHKPAEHQKHGPWD